MSLNRAILKSGTFSKYKSKYMFKAENLENEEKHTTVNVVIHRIIT